MTHRQLGSSKLNVSELSFGCMSLDVHSVESEVLIKRAYDSGINFFDTADLYDRGENERLAGRALKPFRDQVIIATKVGNQWREDGSGWDWNPTKKYILNAVNDSLQRLQTGYIDLYQLHGGTIEDPIDETIEAFERLKEQGKIREYGISSIRPNVIREWAERSTMTSVMMQYSVLDRRPEEEMLNHLHQRGISVITRGSLAKGLLIDKPAKNYLGYSKEEVEHRQNSINKTENPVGTSIQFVLNHPAVASAVLGIRTSDQLESIVASLDTKIPESVFRELSTLLLPKKYENHR